MKPDLVRLLNRTVKIEKVLKVVYGIDIPPNVPFPCPFPDHGSDDLAHPSAVWYEGGNDVYCWAEQRVYSVYDALKAAGKTDNELTSFIVTEMGAESLLKSEKKSRQLADMEAKIGIQLEGTFARFRRGEVPWSDVKPVVVGYFERLSEPEERST